MSPVHQLVHGGHVPKTNKLVNECYVPNSSSMQSKAEYYLDYYQQYYRDLQ